MLWREDSLASSHHPPARRGPRRRRHLLPLDLPPSTQDVLALLGFQPAERRGAPDGHLENQHRAAVGADRRHDRATVGECRCRGLDGRNAVFGRRDNDLEWRELCV